jgi:predicted glycosyltransferase
MKIAFLLSHPAQFLFFRNPVIRLREKGHTVFILVKTKDILSNLLDENGWEYINIHPEERGSTHLAILKSLLIRDIRLLRFARKVKPDLLVGSDASLAHVGRLLHIPCISTTEDDYKVIKKLADLTFPFTSHILTPAICDTGKWGRKKIGYEGFMKLSYLHPNDFIPDRSKVALPMDKPYFLIRLSKLGAHHDFGMKGIRYEVLDQIIRRLSMLGNVYISSEKPLPATYTRYALDAPITEIHHYLYYSSMLICDSQSMAVEASVLGTPSVRISSFSGRISVLEQLEYKYHLTFGIRPEEEEKIFAKIEEILQTPDIRTEFQNRRQRMLANKIDVSAFLTWFIDAYPGSADVMRKDPEYQDRFRSSGS